jgi:branched-chain amino acid aminotransferase
MAGVVFIDGEFVAPEDAKMSIFDCGFMFSDVVYDVLSSWNGYMFKLDQHLERFHKSCEGFRLENPYSREEVRRITAECVERSGLDATFIKLECTRGVIPGDSRDIRMAEQRFTVFAVPYVWVWGEEKCRNGANIHASTNYTRIPPNSIDSRFKNYNRADFNQAKLDGYEVGCDDCVLVSADGALTEGSGWNIMVVKDGRIGTPDTNILLGVTRETTLEICELEGIPFDVRRVEPAEIDEADEVFAVTTAGGVMPLTQFDNKPVGDGTPGPITRQLQDLYWSKREDGWHGTRPADVLAAAPA